MPDRADQDVAHLVAEFRLVVERSRHLIARFGRELEMLRSMIDDSRKALGAFRFSRRD